MSKYRIERSKDGSKYVKVKEFMLWLHEDRIEVKVGDDLIDTHSYSETVRKSDALRNVIMHYHELSELPF